MRESNVGWNLWGNPGERTWTNRDPQWTRNRIRHELLPVLERDYNPQVRDALLRVARLSSEAMGIVDEAVGQLWDRCLLQQTPSLVRLSAENLAGVPEPMVRALLMDLWCRQGWPRQRMSFMHWRGLSRLVVDGTADRSSRWCDCTTQRRGGANRKSGFVERVASWSPVTHRIHLVRPIARCSSSHVHPPFPGLDDHREDGAPEAGFRIFVGVSTDGAWMPVMVSESGLDRFDVNRVLVRFGAGCGWDQSVDAAFSRVRLNQFRKNSG